MIQKEIKQLIKKFVYRRENWTIGICIADSSLHFQPVSNIKNPVLTAKHVRDIQAEFVADPFVIRKDDLWYMFFEALNTADGLGDICLATSTDFFNWSYQQVVLNEPFHLSYPYVFEWNDEYYMIPETYQANEIRLYKAKNFPYQWVFEKTLLTGADYVDSSLVYFNEKWWMFSSTTSNDTLYLHYAEDLLGQWVEHPASPIIEHNSCFARPAGRIFNWHNHLVRLAQDDELAYGRQVYAFKVLELTAHSYREQQMLDGKPMLKAGGSGWNAIGMHHCDLHQIDLNRWAACVDGRGKPTLGLNFFSP